MSNLIDKKKPITREDALPMLTVFNAMHPLSKEAEKYVISNMYPLKISKGKTLHKSGEICEHIYFVLKGAIRGFIVEEGHDNTTWITIENEMVAAIYSFIKQVPSIENMQAIEDCSLIAMSHKSLQEMYIKYPETNVMARKFYEIYYADAEIRAITARLKNAEKKYAYFLERYSHLSTRVPLKHIASFLGIKLETLSRVRGSRAKNNIV